MAKGAEDMNLFKVEQTFTAYYKSDFGNLQTDEATWSIYQNTVNDFLAATKFLEGRLRDNNESCRIGVTELGDE